MEVKHSNYIHPELYTYDDNPTEWERRFLKPELMSNNWELYVHEELLNIYTIPAFTNEFCDFIMEEAEACNCWTVDRHESYPTTDMVLGTIGLGDTYQKILKKYICPSVLFLVACVRLAITHLPGFQLNSSFGCFPLQLHLEGNCTDTRVGKPAAKTCHMPYLL